MSFADDQTPVKPLILIVDDNSENLKVLGNILRDESDDMAIATNGRQALTVAAAEQPDLILLDVMMPDLDGFEVCRQLKAAPATAGIPVIFLTAKVEPEDILNGFKVGAVDYVLKPFNSAELLARVRTQIDLWRARRALETIGRQRKEMLHVLCHDLANPLNAIRGLVEISETPQVLMEHRGYLLQAAENGLAIINVIRVMQTADEHQLALQAVDLMDALRQTMSMLELKLSRKSLRVELPEDSATLLVWAEKASLISSVLTNLLTNAIKFSHYGGRICLALRSDDQRIFLTIRDYGVGMPPALLRDLFDIKKVTRRAGTDGETGTGFGMPLVQRFMRAYGGAISVISSEAALAPEEHGTEVTLTFRAALEAPGMPSASSVT